MREITRLLRPSGEASFFLFGPRGTGKSTLMKSLYADALWIDFLNPKTARIYEARPETLYDFLEANQSSKLVVIDEVQKVPAVLSVVHDLIEQHRGWQFILTGSNARKIKRCGADLLAGRALNYIMHPFMASELRTAFNLQQALQFGLLPLIYSATNKELALQAYINLYLDAEIKMEGLTRNIGDFSRFLEAISFSHGDVVNVSNIARECGVNRKTTESYINILEDLLLIHKLPVFARKAKRELINNSKIYFFDAGIYNALRPRGILDQPEEIDGFGLEGLVLQHLLAWRDYSETKSQISFWRTRSKVEVDFIIYGENEFIALEVKNTKNVNLNDVKGLKSFLEDYPMAQAALLYRGKERIMYRGVLCIPVEDFLLNIFPNRPLSAAIDIRI